MEKIFTQEELFWLDDIMPGSNTGQVRRASVPRNVHIPTVQVDANPSNRSVSH